VRSRIALACAAVLFTGCSGAHATSPVPRSPANAVTRATASLTIPNGRTYTAVHRTTQYVSSSTNSVTLTVTQGATQLVNVSYTVAPTSPYCTTVTNGRTCTFSFAVPNVATGNADVAVQTFDASAQLLSEAQITVAVTVGTTVSIPMTLEGAAASASVAVNGTFSFATGGSLPVVVTVDDADGNAIVGTAPFDNGASVQLSLPAASQLTLTTTPPGGTATTSSTATVLTPATTVTVNAPANATTLGARIGASLVASTTTALPTTVASIIVPPTSNAVDYHSSVSSISSQRATRGPDGDVYFVGNGGLVRVDFTGGTTAIRSCTVSGGAADVAVSAGNLVMYANGANIYEFAASSFPSGGACPGTLVYSVTQDIGYGPSPYNVGAMASNASGVYAAFQVNSPSPSFGNYVYMAPFSSTGVYAGANVRVDNGFGAGGTALIMSGDPQNATAILAYQGGVSEGGQLGAIALGSGGATSFPSTGSPGTDYQNGLWHFAVDPFSANVYLMDTTGSSFGQPVTPALYQVGPGVQIGPAFPSLTSGLAAVGPDSTPVVVAPATAYRFSATTQQFAVTTLSAPSPASTNFTNCVLGADGRIWLTDGSHLMSYPGTGQTVP
jgi:hypothetical protein